MTTVLRAQRARAARVFWEFGDVCSRCSTQRNHCQFAPAPQITFLGPEVLIFAIKNIFANWYSALWRSQHTPNVFFAFSRPLLRFSQGEVVRAENFDAISYTLKENDCMCTCVRVYGRRLRLLWKVRVDVCASVWSKVCLRVSLLSIPH